MNHHAAAWLVAALLGVASLPARGQSVMDAQKLDDAANEAAGTTVPTPTTTRAGSLGNPLNSDSTSIAAQISLLTNDPVNFLARVGSVTLSDWCAFDGIGEIAPFDAPSSVVAGGSMATPSIQAYSYQSLGARFTFGKNVSDIRAADDDTDVSRCCTMRAALSASQLTAEEEAACQNVPDHPTCVFQKKLVHQGPNATQMQATCPTLGVPLDAPNACTANDIMFSRAQRKQGVRVAIGGRILRPSVAQEVVRGTGGAFELEVEYALPAGYFFLSGSAVALQSWTETSGQDSIAHLAAHELRGNAGGLLRAKQFSASLALSLARNSYTDPASKRQDGTRADATLQLGWSFTSKVTGGLRVSAVKPIGVAFKDTDRYDYSYGLIPSVGGSF